MLMNRENGFTLIELMVTVAVMAVLLTVVVPSFTLVIQNNRLVTGANHVVTALNLARSESIKLGQAVNVSANGADWNSGIVVRTAAGTDIRFFEPFTGNITVTGTVATVSYQADGRVTAAAAFSICDSSRSGETGRSVTVTATGRIATTNLVCG